MADVLTVGDLEREELGWHFGGQADAGDKIAFLQEYTARKKKGGGAPWRRTGKTPNMNFPVWFDGQNINEALFVKNFCMSAESSSQRSFFHADGRVTDDLPAWGDL